jgi:hypothetical protein
VGAYSFIQTSSTPVEGLDPEAKVSSLPDPVSGGWNIPLVRRSFTIFEAEAIYAT